MNTTIKEAMQALRTCFSIKPVSAEPDPSYRSVIENLTTVKESYSDLADLDVAEAWCHDIVNLTVYKQGKKAQDTRFHQLFVDCVSRYAELASALPALSPEQKAAKLAITADNVRFLEANLICHLII